MPNFTKRAIRDTFLRQLAQRPLNQITVKDIVEECGINRNSFYYHYEGIPALLEEIIAGELDRLTKAYPNIDSMEHAVDAAVEFIRANKRVFVSKFYVRKLLSPAFLISPPASGILVRWKEPEISSVQYFSGEAMKWRKHLIMTSCEIRWSRLLHDMTSMR